MAVRTLIGLVLGVVLFIFGIPVLQSVVRQAGYYDPFTYEQAVLAMLLILASVIAVQLTGLRPPRERD
jgi:ABC-type branched-subunit amino acid transport system permease subunit